MKFKCGVNQRITYSWRESDSSWALTSRLINDACEKIRQGKGEEVHWRTLHELASPTLVQAMVREVLMRKAGLDPYAHLKQEGWMEQHKPSCKCETCRAWGAWSIVNINKEVT